MLSHINQESIVKFPYKCLPQHAITEWINWNHIFLHDPERFEVKIQGCKPINWTDCDERGYIRALWEKLGEFMVHLKRNESGVQKKV